MNAQQLTQDIRSAFDPVVSTGPITSCNCDECLAIQRELENKRWDEVPNEFVDFTLSPTLLSPRAFVAFLPAYLLRALNDLSRRGRVLEFTISCLSPTDSEECGSDPSKEH